MDKSFVIVLPVMNAGKSLELTLKSIVAQGYGNFELLICYAPSTDNTLEIINSFQGQVKMRIIKDQGQGIFQAMNLAINECGDSFICFLGSGDYFVSSEVLSYVSRLVQSEEDWTLGPWIFASPNGRLIAEPQLQNYGINDVCKTTTPICHQTVFMHKKFLSELGGFDLRYKVASDRDLILRAWEKQSPIVMANCTVVYIDEGFSAKNSEIGHSELKIIDKSAGNLSKIKRLVTKKKFSSSNHFNYASESLVLFEWLSEEISDAIHRFNLAK